MGTFPVPVGAQLGHAVGAKSIVWAQYGKVQYGHSMGTVGAQLGHERVKCQKNCVLKVQITNKDYVYFGTFKFLLK